MTNKISKELCDHIKKNISNGAFPIKGDVSILPGLFGHAT